MTNLKKIEIQQLSFATCLFCRLRGLKKIEIQQLSYALCFFYYKRLTRRWKSSNCHLLNVYSSEWKPPRKLVSEDCNIESISSRHDDSQEDRNSAIVICYASLLRTSRSQEDWNSVIVICSLHLLLQTANAKIEIQQLSFAKHLL
jgi:hypothetical protein